LFDISEQSLLRDAQRVHPKSSYHAPDV
jgi:hypothetical protein